MAVTIGGVPPTTEQQAEMRAALGLPEPFDLTATKLTLVGADKVIGLDSEDADTPKLFTLNGIATFTGASPGTLEGTMAAAETGADVFDGVGASGGSGLSLEGDSGYNAISIYLGPDNTVPIPATVAEGDTVFLFVQEFFVAGSLGSVVDDQGHAYTDVTPVAWPAGMRMFRSETITAGTMPTTITLPYTGGDYIASGRCFVARGTISTVTGFTDTTAFTADPHVIDYTTTVNDAIVFGQNIWTGGGVTGSTPDGLHAWVQTDPDTPSSSYSFLREVATAGAATATITPVGSGTGSEAYGVIIQAAA